MKVLHGGKTRKCNKNTKAKVKKMVLRGQKLFSFKQADTLLTRFMVKEIPFPSNCIG